MAEVLLGIVAMLLSAAMLVVLAGALLAVWGVFVPAVVMKVAFTVGAVGLVVCAGYSITKGRTR